MHDSDVLARLTRFLARKSMPRRLDGKPDAEADETRALCAVVSRNAPRGADRLAAWWPLFEARLGEVCGGMWPTEKELRDVAAAASKDAPRATSEGTGPDNSDAAITARKMERGEAVGEGWLYGIGAVELAARGLIDRATMEKYRSAAFIARKQTYGQDAALEWEEWAKSQHEAAKDVWRHRDDRKQRRDTTTPNKSTEGYAA